MIIFDPFEDLENGHALLFMTMITEVAILAVVSVVFFISAVDSDSVRLAAEIVAVFAFVVFLAPWIYVIGTVIKNKLYPPDQKLWMEKSREIEMDDYKSPSSDPASFIFKYQIRSKQNKKKERKRCFCDRSTQCYMLLTYCVLKFSCSKHYLFHGIAVQSTALI